MLSGTLCGSRGGSSPRAGAWSGGLAAVLLAFGLAGAGCKSSAPTPLSEGDKKPYTLVGVQPGDVVRINFPGAATMNSVAQVQSDGTIALPLGGSLLVRGKSPSDVEKEILKTYGDQLVVKEVSVSLESGGFPVFVSGAVLRQGRVQCRQSMTALEAVVEAGGFLEGRADLRRVKVVRQQDDGTTKTYLLDLRSALRGESGQQFYLRPSDVVYVPERFSFY